MRNQNTGNEIAIVWHSDRSDWMYIEMVGEVEVRCTPTSKGYSAMFDYDPNKPNQYRATGKTIDEALKKLAAWNQKKPTPIDWKAPQPLTI